jgi:DNA mismatch repair protein MutS2
MAFDEKNLLPMYKLAVGKPGSSYTFAIAERIGLDKRLISRARSMVDEAHFTLDNCLTEPSRICKSTGKEKELHRLMKENERLKKEMEQVLDKERHRQQVELLKQQNKITEDRLTYLKDMERKLRQWSWNGGRQKTRTRS